MSKLNQTETTGAVVRTMAATVKGVLVTVEVVEHEAGGYAQTVRENGKVIAWNRNFTPAMADRCFRAAVTRYTTMAMAC